MAGIKDAFSKGITTINMKTNGLMEQNKLKTYISTLTQQEEELYSKLGRLMYQNWKEGRTDTSVYTGMMQEIDKKKATIAEQQKKIEEIKEQENQVLGTAGPAVDPNAVFCGHCGAQNNAGSRFCFRCGQQL